MIAVRVAIAAALAAVLIGGFACGGEEVDGGSSADGLTEATLVLDYLPNGVHAGIYEAIASGAYENAGIDLKVITPASTADTIRLIQAGKADFGLADGIDVATQIDAGRDARAVMAITQRPAGGLITLADEDIRTPADLGGRTVGVTGLPSDTAVFETMVRDAGENPDRSKVVTVGFGGIQGLIAGRISAFTGYIPADGPVVESRGKPVRSFAFDDFGGPSYPGLVAFSTGKRIASDPELVGAFVEATISGYQQALSDPAGAVADLVEVVPELDPDLSLKTFEAYEPLFGGQEDFGGIDRRDLAALSDFMLGSDLIAESFTPEQFADATSLRPPAPQP